MMSTPNEPDEASAAYSTREVAEAHGVAISTVIRWAELGKLPYIRKLPGRTGGYLFPAEALPGGRP
jgi:predicted site-specific integrase-resolvase